jgi:hypothetical protein
MNVQEEEQIEPPQFYIHAHNTICDRLREYNMPIEEVTLPSVYKLFVELQDYQLQEQKTMDDLFDIMQRNMTVSDQVLCDRLNFVEYDHENRSIQIGYH